MNGAPRTMLVVGSVVLMMALGQLLFKATASAWHQHATLWAAPVLLRLVFALAVYGVATIAWIWVLQRVPLTVAYPLVALTFVLVPLGAWWCFKEVIGLRYLLGTGLIVVGIIIATSENASNPMTSEVDQPATRER